MPVLMHDGDEWGGSSREWSKILLRISMLPILAFLGGGSLLSGGAVAFSATQEPTTELLTVAESSGYSATSRFEDVVAFVDRCAREAAHVQRIDIGETVEGRPIVAAVVGNPFPLVEKPTADAAREPLNDSRVVCLLLGNIHSGECAGKEALLMLLRELARSPDSPLLKDLVLIFVPNYNADGNQRIGSGQYHRPGQIGPEAGMGLRENAQQLDLNRDFVKLEAPETRALVRLMNQYDVDVLIDLHTTNGSRHRYDLTYDFPHHPAVFPEIKQFLVSELLPNVTRNLSQEGIETFYYGNFDRRQTQWRTFGYEGRYSTEYAGLSNRIGILSEAYSYVSYERRIVASREFVRQCLTYVAENTDRVRQIRSQAENWGVNAFAKNEALAMSANLESFPEKVVIKGYRNDEPADIEAEWVANFRPAERAVLPLAYVIPQEFSQAVDRLVMHGIEVQQLTAPLRTEVLIDRCVKLTRPDRPFQGHRTTQLESTRRSEVRDIPAKSFLVPVNQRYARLLGTLLEPNSIDSLYTWNFFSDQVSEGQDLPVIRIDEPVEWTAAVVKRVEPSELLTLAKIDGPIGQIDLGSSIVADPQWFDDQHYLMTWNGRRYQVNVETGGMIPAADRLPTRDVLAAFQKFLQEQQLAASQPDRGDLPEIVVEEAQLIVAADRQAVLLVHADDLYALSAQGLAVRRLTHDGTRKQLIQFSPDQRWVSYVDGNSNLCVASLESGEARALTTDGSPEILNGRLDWVYQEELYGRGNFTGYWWNPSSSQLAFLRLDQTAVPRYTIVDQLPLNNGLESLPYPKAGDPNPQVRLGVVDLMGRTEWANPDDSAQTDLLISNVAWDKTGSAVYFQVQNRQQTWLDLCRFTPGNPTAVLFRDQTPAWIESPGAPHWLNDGGFLWLSPRSGWRQIYHYDANGQLIAEVTQSGVEVQQILGVSPSQDQVFFTAYYPSPTELHAHRVTLSGGMVNRLTSLGASHKVTFNRSYSHFIDESSSISVPKRIELRSSEGRRIRILETRIDDRLNYLKANAPELIKVPTSDGGSLDAYLIRPADFDSTKKYPVLFHVYAGPQAPRVKNEFGGKTYLWHQYLAQQGICVWICDNRSATRSASKSAWPIHRNLGQTELADILEGYNWLKDQSWVDEKQIGLWGWSYGGYMTAYAMTHSKVFRAGISGAPVTDWRNYDSIYTERYLGLPSDNPDGYRKSSVIEAAANLSGDLLLIHGGIDDNVHINNSMQLVKALQDSGVSFEMMIYPANRHAVTQQQQVRHMRKLMTDFLLKRFKPVASPSSP
jgi:dipeptidyl aminopeptidase/acylaminoacyl peptidase/murein tripeptide amidase MpaA